VDTAADVAVDLELVPTTMTAGGDALARDESGRVVFVEGALPGERVRAQAVEVKKDYARAVALEVLEASPDRVAAPCAARRAGCGGCSWQHVRPSAQGGLKRSIVVDALRRTGGLDVDGLGIPVTVRAAVATAERPLRTTVRLAVDAAGRAGLRRGRGHQVVPADACLAVHPRLEELVVGARFPGATEVVLRVGVASGERAAQVDAPDPQLPADVAVGPDAVIHESVAGAWLRVSMASFFQSGPVAAEAIVAAVDDALGDAGRDGGHLVDAYAGVGLLGATIGARRGLRVTAIETGRSAVADAVENLERAGVDATVVRSEVGRWRPPSRGRRGGRAARIDAIVADPARSGLGRPGVSALAAADAPRLVLVSCDPGSLGRDVRLLADAGYDLASVELVDAFPDTFHVEAVCRFDRRPGSA
jgi:23S rRNA (uracil1939-C5)-methyltransferase